MKITEAIQHLQDALNELGDVDVYVHKYSSEPEMIAVETDSYQNDEMETVHFARIC